MEETNTTQDQAQPVSAQLEQPSAPVSDQAPVQQTKQDMPVQPKENKTVPLAAMIEERKRFQRQIDQEKSIRKNYETTLSKLNQGNPVDELMAQYDTVYRTKGKSAAEAWFENLTGQAVFKVQTDNQQLLQELQTQYNDVYTVPEVKSAIDAFIDIDLDTSKSLREQGLPDVIKYIDSIYKAGYQSAMNLRNQNDSAKARMGSSVLDAVPSSSSGRAFTRSEIAKMDVDTFLQNEKSIFDQLGKGLIK